MSEILTIKSVILFFTILFFCAFLYFFFIKSFGLSRQLKRFIAALRVDTDNDFDQMGNVFQNDLKLLHLWNEYRKTLYINQKRSTAEKKVYQATTLADSIWNGEMTVDGRIYADLFKHLPGVLTGLGIIATFSGLISGLQQFKIIDTTIIDEQVSQTTQQSLELLLSAVSDAFFVSAIAISLAMLVTLFEKWRLTALYSQVEKIATALDAKFSSTTPEELLEQSVMHAAESSTQLKHLKTDLITDLKPLMHEFSVMQENLLTRLLGHLEQKLEDSTNKQIVATEASSTQIKNGIENGIIEAFKEPLDKIAGSVQAASGAQSDQAVKMLADVTSAFSAQLNEIFGAQIKGINELNQKTSDKMQEAISALTKVVENSRESDNKFKEDFSLRMTESLEKIAQLQQSMQDKNIEFIDYLKEMLKQSQKESTRQFMETMEQLKIQLDSVLQSVGTTINKTEGQMKNYTDEVQQNLTDLSAKISNLIVHITECTAAMNSTVTRVSENMENGAVKIHKASSEFSNSSKEAAATMSTIAQISNKLDSTIIKLNNTTNIVENGMETYAKYCGMMEGLVQQLQEMLNNNEQSIINTTELISTIDTSTQKFNHAHIQVEEFMENVTEVLAQSVGAFQETLTTQNMEYQKHLNTAVSLLARSIDELTEITENLTDDES